jgi:hypothetical protein
VTCWSSSSNAQKRNLPRLLRHVIVEKSTDFTSGRHSAAPRPGPRPCQKKTLQDCRQTAPREATRMLLFATRLNYQTFPRIHHRSPRRRRPSLCPRPAPAPAQAHRRKAHCRVGERVKRCATRDDARGARPCPFRWGRGGGGASSARAVRRERRHPRQQRCTPHACRAVLVFPRATLRAAATA